MNDMTLDELREAHAFLTDELAKADASLAEREKTIAELRMVMCDSSPLKKLRVLLTEMIETGKKYEV